MWMQHKIGKKLPMDKRWKFKKTMLRPLTWRKLMETACSRKTKLSGWSLKTVKDLMNFPECRAPDRVLNN